MPYVAIALLTALLVGTTADLTLAAATVEIAFRASLIWLLLLLPVGAVLGALGGLISGSDALQELPVLRPRRAFLVTSVVVVAVLLLGVGSVAALNLLGGGSERQSGSGQLMATAGQEDASTEAASATEQQESATTPPAREEGSDEAEKAKSSASATESQSEKVVSPEEPPGPAPGYNRIQDPSGSLTVEVPSSWGAETGSDSEGRGGPNSWSYYAGEYIPSSITTARSLDA